MKDNRVPRREARFASILGAGCLALGVLVFLPAKASAQASAQGGASDSASSAPANQPATPAPKPQKALKCRSTQMGQLVVNICPAGASNEDPKPETTDSAAPSKADTTESQPNKI